MHVRRMRPEDYAAYCTLLCEVHGLHHAERSDVFAQNPVFPTEVSFAEALNDVERVQLVAVEADQVIGMCLMQVRRPANPAVQPVPTGWIEELCVREGEAGRGVGRALYEAMRDEARALNLARLELMAWAFNENARAFYEHLGLTERSRIMEERL